MKSISFVTLGCKVNQYDTAVLINKLPKSKYTTVPFPGKADIYVIDTCTVTHKADAEARHYINRAKRINPNGVVVVTGCYAQVSAEEISNLKGVDYVVGNSDKFSSLMKIVRQGSLQKEPKIFINDIFKEKKRKFESPEIDFFPGRTRAFLKIQDGCNYACTFCIIPYARGRSRSLGIDDVIKRIRVLRQSGYKEAVLTGIHLASYGRDIGSNLVKLLSRIEDEKILSRIRLSSLDPADINQDFINFVSNSQTICPSFHISLQSGDEQVLKNMRRRYKPKQFLDITDQIRQAMPDSSIGTDIMVGFPGETEAEFNNSYNLLDESELTYFHVFSYSKRKGTKAAIMDNQIDPAVIKQRSKRIRDLGMKKKIEFNKKFVGKELEVLVENNSKGTSRNYISVKLHKDDYSKGELIDVVISDLEDDMVIATKYIH
jgi:threonylcarbamoyladenosine tRNA methylthiotransferase MtaB